MRLLSNYLGSGRMKASRGSDIIQVRHRDGVSVARLLKDYGVAKLTMTNALYGRGVYGKGAYVA